MEYISREDSDNIKRLNSVFGTSHRYIPYDFKKSGDVIEAVTMATAEYLDLFNCWNTLNKVDEAFDRSLEHYNTAAWLKIGLKGFTGVKKIDIAQVCLQNTVSFFYELVKDAKEKCSSMWRIVLFNSDDTVKEHFFGKDFTFGESEVEKALEHTFSLSDEMEYTGDIEASAKAFADAISSIYNERCRQAVKQ